MRPPDTSGSAQFEKHNQSGAILGADNAKRLTTYLEKLCAAGHGLPSRNGRVNTSAVALACGLSRAVLYQNPAARRLLQEAVSKLGLYAPIVAHKAAPVDPRDQRIMKLEHDNANLKAETLALRRALRKAECVEELMVETGKRVSR